MKKLISLLLSVFVIASCVANGLEYIGLIESPIKGGDGNTEFLAVFKYLS